VNPRGLALKSTPTLHLDLGLDEVGGRGDQLAEAAGRHSGHDFLPKRKSVLKLAPIRFRNFKLKLMKFFEYLLLEFKVLFPQRQYFYNRNNVNLQT